MRRIGCVVFVCVGILFFANTTASAQEDPLIMAQISPVSGDLPAPDFKLEDLEGNTVRLSDYRGKMVMLFFWATW